MGLIFSSFLLVWRLKTCKLCYRKICRMFSYFLIIFCQLSIKISLIVSLILDLRGRSRRAGQSLQPPAGRSQYQPRGHAAPVSRGVPPPENLILIKKNKICSNCESMIDCYVKYGRKKIKDNFVLQII